MTDEPFDLHPAAAAVATLVAAVRGDALGDRTPCRDYLLGDELDHLSSLTYAFAAMGDKTFDTPAAQARLQREGAGTVGRRERLPADWRDDLPRRLHALAEAWAAPSAWEGTTSPGGFTMPAAQCARVALGEICVHGWDVARATGLPFELDPATAAVLRAYFEDAAPVLSTGGAGFDPPVTVPAGASDLEVAVALSGRDPAWTP
ncbi:TIGR03086 family metal-binding protein [Angustibacter aerolatus]|nr:TIGR03086 family metal-binding protein [Angustibacter aerolatus]